MAFPFLLVVPVFLASGAGRSWALGIEQCISADGHVYVIVTTMTAGIGTQVTSVAMTQGSANACVQQAGPMIPVVSAFAGAVGAPLGNRMRTTVLSGFSSNVVTCMNNFDPEGAGGRGTLALPGPLARTVSVDPGVSTENLVPLEEADPAVPAASDMRRIRSSRLRCRGDTIVFPVGGDGSRTSNGRHGEVPDQAVTLDDTPGTRVGNPETQDTPDGFLLQGNCSGLATCQMIVFIGELDSPCGVGASASAAGFSVNGDLITGAAEAAMQSGGHRDCSSDSR